MALSIIRRQAFGYAFIIAMALAVLPVHAQVLHCLRTLIKAEYISEKRGADVAQLYKVIFLGVPFHSDKKVSKMAYDIFAANLSNEAWKIYRDLRKMTNPDKKFLVERLAKLNNIEQAQILSKFDNWVTWKNEYSEPGPSSGSGPEYVTIDGKKVEKNFYNYAMQIKGTLALKRIEVEFAPDMTFGDEHQGRGLLVIKAAKGGGPQTGKPSEKIIGTSDFDAYLAQVQNEGGVIVIDPVLSSATTKAEAYFRAGSANPNVKYIIAIKEDTSRSNFIHEWEHKVDRIDKKDHDPKRIAQEANPRKTPLGRGIYEAGKKLEADYLIELNAIAKQYNLYFSTKSFPPLITLKTIIYEGSNLQKVSIGRIFMDPANPMHYIFYIRGVGQVVIPFGGMIAGSYYAPLLAAITLKAALALARPNLQQQPTQTETDDENQRADDKN